MIIERQRGDTYDHLFQLLDEDNSPITLTSETFTLTINTEENPTDTSNQVLTVGGAIVDANSGKISFNIDGSEPLGTNYFDIQMTDNAGNLRTIVKGQWVIEQDITK